MSKAFQKLAALASLCLLCACGGRTHSSAGNNNNNDEGNNPCLQLFALDTAATGGTTATVTGGALRLTAGSMPQYAPPTFIGRSYGSEPFNGDFAIEVHFEAFASGGAGALFRAELRDDNDAAIWANGTIDGVSTAQGTSPALTSAIVTNGTYDETTDANLVGRGTDDDAGIISFQLQGDTLTVSTSAASNTAVVSDTGFAGRTFTLHIQLSTNNTNSNVANPTSVHVTEITGPFPVATSFECANVI